MWLICLDCWLNPLSCHLLRWTIWSPSIFVGRVYKISNGITWDNHMQLNQILDTIVVFIWLCLQEYVYNIISYMTKITGVIKIFQLGHWKILPLLSAGWRGYLGAILPFQAAGDPGDGKAMEKGLVERERFDLFPEVHGLWCLWSLDHFFFLPQTTGSWHRCLYSIDDATYLRHRVCMLTLFLQSRARGGHGRMTGGKKGRKADFGSIHRIHGCWRQLKSDDVTWSWYTQHK